MPKYLTEFTGEKIYVDSSVFLFVAPADSEYGSSSLQFLQHASQSDMKLVISSLTVDEISFVALKAKLEERLDITSGQVLYLKKHPEVIKTLAPEVNRITENILRLSDIIGVGPEDIQRLTYLMETYGLLPRDALHIAVMQRCGLTDIASSDADFDRVVSITRYTPEKS